MKRSIAIKNLDCVHCAAALSKMLNRIEGIEGAVADKETQTVTLAYSSEEALAKAKEVISHFEEVEIISDRELVEREDCADSCEEEKASCKCDHHAHENEHHGREESCECGREHHGREHDHHGQEEGTKEKVICIRNLDCAGCAAELSEELEGIDGIEQAVVDFVTQRVSLQYSSEEALTRAIYSISHFEEVEIVQEGGAKLVKIRNLDCAACAAELSEELNGIDGITNAVADFINQQVSFTAASEEAYEKAIYCISHFEEVEIVGQEKKELPKKDYKWKELVSIGVSGALFLLGLVLQLTTEINPWWLFGIYLASALATGWQVIATTVKNIPRAFRNGFHGSVLLDENTLMMIAGIGAFAVGEYMEGAAVMLLYEIGEYLQAMAVGSSRNAITKLMELKTDVAILLEGEERRQVPPETLKEGDLILLRKGDRVPADCILQEGKTQLDTKSLTGESYFREVEEGDEILSGCVNEGAVVKARVVRPSSESAVAKILDMVETSSMQKAKPEKFITRFARVYTPVVVLLALLVAVIPPLFDGNWSRWIMSALNFLVISCPCGLIISVPLTYFSGVGSLAKCGILAKGAVYLDALAKVKVAAFDKTGTLTEGKFSVSKVNGEARALALAAAVEKLSSHPLAQAFEGVEGEYRAEQCEEIAGRGLSAQVDGKQILVGSIRLMREYGVECEEVKTPASVVYVAEEGKLVGSVEIEDKVKEEAKEALTELKECGVQKTVMLTGDGKARAEAIAKELPLDEIAYELLPEQKPEKAAQLKGEGILLYVGDGINDTPVMTMSDVAVSMGALGSDAAIEASDLVLVSDNLSALPKAIRAGKKTRKIVIENIVFSIAVKVAFMALSVLGLVPLWLAIFADVGVMLLAVLNSMRMRAKIK